MTSKSISLSIPSDLDQSSSPGGKCLHVKLSEVSAEKIAVEEEIDFIRKLSKSCLVDEWYAPTCSDHCIPGICFKCSAADLRKLVSVCSPGTESTRVSNLVDNPCEHFWAEKGDLSAKTPFSAYFSSNKSNCNEKCSEASCFECSTENLCRMATECYPDTESKRKSSLVDNPFQKIGVEKAQV